MGKPGKTIDRRAFLKVGLSTMAYYSLAATTPNWIVRTAQGIPSTPFNEGRILIILQMAGGNDGLNTVIPRADPIYYDAATRPTIKVPFGSEIDLQDGKNGLHPRLPGIATRFGDGEVAIVHNVGYLNPNLSHFTSTDYFEFGYGPGLVKPTQGWISRFFDNACAGAPDVDPIAMIAAGKTVVPDSMSGSNYFTPPAISDPAFYGLGANNDAAERLAAITALNSLSAANPEIDFLQRSEAIAEASSADVATAIAQPDLLPDGSYPDTTLGRALKLISQIIRAGFDTRIFYCSQGGYDTHANQVAAGNPLVAGDHPVLLAELDQALTAFWADMGLSGNKERVMLMTFSEFGRRVAENNSFGCDHGAANCLFVMGGQVKGGVYGGQPDLANLQKGNLKYKIDFRSVYGKIINGWFGYNPELAFGETVNNSIIQPDIPKLGFIEGLNAVAPAVWRGYR